MRLSNSFNLKNAMNYGVKRVVRAVCVPFQVGYRKIVQLFSPTTIVGKVSSDIKQEIKKVGEKPKSLKGYYAIGERYVAKKLVYVLVLLAILLPVLWVKLAWPWVQSRFLTKTMVVNSQDMKGYSGKVRLLNTEDGTVIFEGTLTDGRINGEGSLYSHEGNLLYRGGFLSEQYSGMGESYYANGNLKYRGEFAVNAYDGTGTLYNEDGSLLYEGSFAAGLYAAV